MMSQYAHSVEVEIVIRHRTKNVDLACVKITLGRYMELGRDGGFVDIKGTVYTCVHFGDVDGKRILWVEG